MPFSQPGSQLGGAVRTALSLPWRPSQGNIRAQATAECCFSRDRAAERVDSGYPEEYEYSYSSSSSRRPVQDAPPLVPAGPDRRPWHAVAAVILVYPGPRGMHDLTLTMAHGPQPRGRYE